MYGRRAISSQAWSEDKGDNISRLNKDQQSLDDVSRPNSLSAPFLPCMLSVVRVSWMARRASGYPTVMFCLSDRTFPPGRHTSAARLSTSRLVVEKEIWQAGEEAKGNRSREIYSVDESQSFA